jgi:PAS domain S-box-containing protein
MLTASRRLVGALSSWWSKFPSFTLAASIAACIALAIFLRPQGHSDRPLRIGFQNAAPTQFRDANGKPSGPVTAVIDRAALRSNVRLEWIFSPEGPEAALTLGAVDLWPMLGDIPERRDIIHVSRPWNSMNYILVAPQSLHLQCSKDYRGSTLAVADINLDLRLANKYYSGVRKVLVPDASHIVESVCTGKAQAGLLSNGSLSAISNNFCAERPLMALAIPNASIWFGIGAPVGNLNAQRVSAVLRKEIGKMASDGSLAEIDFYWKSNLNGEINSIFQYDKARSKSFWLTAAVGILLLGLLGMTWLIFSWKWARRQSEAALKALASGEKRLHFTLHCSGIGLWNWEIGRDAITADETCATLYGLQPGRFPKTNEESLARVHPGDREKVRRQMAAAVESRGDFDTEMRVVWPDGTVRTLTSRGNFVSGDKGDPPRLMGATWDVTERRATEKNLRAAQVSLATEAKFHRLLEAAPDAVVVMNETGEIVLVNAQLEKLFGYARQELVGLSIAKLVPVGLLESQQGLVTKTGLELVGLHKDGSEFPTELTLSLVEGEKGVLTTCAIRDITGRKLVEQEILDLNGRLKLSAEQAQAANRTKSAFLSTMSHEIRTPMNAVLGYTQLMLRDPTLRNDIAENLRIVNRNGEHLLTIINDVLDMAKIDAGRIEIKPAPFDIAVFMSDLVAMFGQRAHAKDLRFDHFLDGEPFDCIIADEGKIHQVLVNLLGNAIKFTARGRVCLRLSLNRRTDNGTWLTAEVEDTGPGIALDEQANLFQPFSQTQAGLNTVGGTGLGLAISRQLAILMGGDIALSSTPGIGSVFQFEIPVVPGNTGLPAKELARGQVIGLRNTGETPRILIADDKVDNRDWLFKLLTSVGFSVREAANGETAILAWEEWNPHAILMDVHMPLMGGIEAMAKIRALPAGEKTVIITLTASAMADERQLALENGATDFLSKPCREEELLEKLQSHLGLAYRYEELPANTASPLTPEQLRHFPPNLLTNLLNATLNGNKGDLDTLILEVKESVSERSAQALQELADSYEYDRLVQLLEQV